MEAAQQEAVDIDRLFQDSRTEASQLFRAPQPGSLLSNNCRFLPGLSFNLIPHSSPEPFSFSLRQIKPCHGDRLAVTLQKTALLRLGNLARAQTTWYREQHWHSGSPLLGLSKALWVLNAPGRKGRKRGCLCLLQGVYLLGKHK